jgi:hypothetical protein
MIVYLQNEKDHEGLIVYMKTHLCFFEGLLAREGMVCLKECEVIGATHEVDEEET